MGDRESSTQVVSSGAASIDAMPSIVETESDSGTRLGRYRLEGVLGRGGMGVVYAAFDPELDRAVALKVMRFAHVGSGTAGESQARMLREAQALAGLAHPNVVTVYDVGRFGDLGYIAMELIDGQTLQAWMRAGPHPWARVAEIMLEAGRGLVAAHRQGIVHRDFKPANVLIGADGRVRVADFGLARSGTSVESSCAKSKPATGSERVEPSSSRLPVLTEAGAVMGTPGYMAPEQFAGEQLDARSDQFSYCVSFYEALHGHRPYEGENRREVLRNVRLGNIRRPATGRRVPAGLQAAILRGLAADPDARWSSLEELLERVERLLDRRGGSRRWWFAGGLVFAVGTAGVFAFRPASDPCTTVVDELRSIWSADRRAVLSLAVAERGGEGASETWERFADRIDDHASEWIATRMDACRSRDLPAARRDATVACLARRRAELEALVEAVEAPDAETLRGAVMAVAKLRPSTECRSAAEGQELEPPSADIAADVQRLREQLASVSVFRDTRRFERALEVGRAVLRAAEELGYAPLRAEVLYRHGRTHSELAEYDAAARYMEDAFYTALACGHDDVAASAASALYFLYAYRRGDREAGARWLSQAEAATQRMGATGGNARWRLAQDRGTVAIRDGEYERAQDLLTESLAFAREHYGGDNLQTAGIIGNLGVAQLERGDHEGARRSFESAIELSERIVGPDHPRRASWLNNLGVIEQNRGNHEASLELFRRAYDLEAAVLGDAHPAVGMGLNNIGGALAYLGRNVEAREYFERSIAVYDIAKGFDPLDRARPIGNLGRTLAVLGDDAAGIPRLLEAIQIIEDTLGPAHPELAPHCLNLGSAYSRIEQHEAALRYMQRAHDIDLETLGPEHPFVATTMASIGEVHLALGRHERAVELIERALAIQERETVDAVNLAATRFGLARALWPDTGQRARATELLDLAEAAFESAGPAGAARLADLRAWRAND